jgi:uncharacterized protein (TIGR03083 family)
MRVHRDVVFAAVADERRRVASLLGELTEPQLTSPSLCAGWNIKTVGAHVLSTVVDGLPVFLRQAVCRRSLARGIDELARQRAQRTAAEIASELRRCADRPVDPPLFGPLDPLADVLVHRGDMTIPLNLPFEPEPEFAALALDFLTSPWPFGFVPLGRLRRISLCSTDIDRRWGKGAEVYGPVAALMITTSGRTALLDRLHGPGLSILRRRVINDRRNVRANR